MAANWQEDLGYTVPHTSVYPWMWLWDSCFHSIIWLALGNKERARRELGAVFAAQTPTGFVPHMRYGRNPDNDLTFWGISGASTITQPPLYGHALAVLAGSEVDVAHLVGPVTAAFHHLFERRATPCGLLRTLHPWESGADDSPRWERWQSRPFDRRTWWETKGRLVDALKVEGREAVGSDAFEVCPASWNALVAWNAAEAALVTGDGALAAAARQLAATLDDLCWNEQLGTWIDVSPNGSPTSGIRTCDSLLGLLVTLDQQRATRVLDALVDPDQYGAPFGPTGVHRLEPSYDPSAYWRGGAWPPLDYLWRTAADRRGKRAHAAILNRALLAGASTSSLSEYRHPVTGASLGAQPQAWAGLAAVPRELAALT
jgi:hypothetical protein